jgi:integrase
VLLTDEDVVQIEKGLPNELTRTVWWLGACTGARKGELRALRVGSTDGKAGQLIITRSRFEGKEGPPKSRKSIRRIDLTRTQLARLKQYLRSYPDALPEDYLFPSRRKRKGKPVPVCLERLMEKIIKPVAKKLGIEKVGWHMLRHWNSTTMDEAGFSSKVRQERLGHASATTTNEYYTHVRNTFSRKAARGYRSQIGSQQKKDESW